MASDYNWSPEQQGRVLSSFFVGYLLTQVAGGWLAGRYGGKVVLGGGVIFWSLFTILTPVAAAGGLTALLVTRVLMGVGEGITFPSIYAMFGRWIPETERSRAIGILFSTIPLGSVFALLATPWIVMHYGYSMLTPGPFAAEILAMLPDGVAMLRADERIRSANEGLARLAERSVEELEDTPIGDPNSIVVNVYPQRAGVYPGKLLVRGQPGTHLAPDLRVFTFEATVSTPPMLPQATSTSRASAMSWAWALFRSW